MDLGLAGKTALVTGSAGGIGLAAAVGLARDVYVCSAAASATNGAALRVDGGVIRSIL